jgi:hypothetical protein
MLYKEEDMDLIKVYKKEFLRSEYFIITISMDGIEKHESVLDTIFCKSYDTTMVDLLDGINKALRSWDGTKINLHYEEDSWNCECCGLVIDSTYTFTNEGGRVLFEFKFDGHFGNNFAPSTEEIISAYEKYANVKLEFINE